MFSNKGVLSNIYTIRPSANILLSDTFTESGTGEIDFNTHTADTGATYTDHPHANYPGPLVLNRDLDRIYGLGTSASYASVVPSSADYIVEADFYVVTAISVNLAVCARMDTTADTMYIVRLNGGTIWEMRKIVAASAATLDGGAATSTSQLPTAGGAPKRGKFVLSGSTLSFYSDDNLIIGPITDSSITAVGRPGLRSAGASSSTTGLHIDNFQVSE